MKNGITMIPFGLGKKEMKITAGSDKTFVKFSCFVADLLKLWYSEAILSKYIQKNLKKYTKLIARHIHSGNDSAYCMYKNKKKGAKKCLKKRKHTKTICWSGIW